LLTVSALGATSGCPAGDDDATTAADEGDSDGGPSDGASSEASAEESTTSASSTGVTDTSGSATDPTTDDGGTTRAETESDSAATTGSACSFGGDTGGGPVCDAAEQAECEAIEVCLWAPPGYCYADCLALADEASCCAEAGCIWLGDVCEYGGI
jgi:hypothetical protein